MSGEVREPISPREVFSSMRRTFHRTLAAVSALPLVALPFTACTTTTGETLGRNIDDTTITSTVKADLAKESVASLTRVGVTTVQGTVYLTGTVDSQRTKQRATDIAGHVSGVRAVVNNLQVQGASANN
jgi:hyperosmotically inducible periplasmic protein